MRRSYTIAFAIVMLAATTGCTGGTGSATMSASGVDNTYLLSKETLNDLGLEQFIEEKLYEKRELRDAYILGDHIIVETRDKWIYGINRMSGDTDFAEQLTYACDFRGCEDEQYLYLVCRNTMVAIDKRGFKEYTKYLKYSPAGVPAQDETHIFLPCYDGAIRAFLKEKGYFAWQYTTRGVVSAQPAVGSKLVYAASNDGWLYGLERGDLQEAWKFKTYGPILAGLVYDDLMVYVASTDGNLYCLEGQAQDTRQRQMVWPRPYSSGADIRITPVVAPDMVLVINDNRECHAVEKKTGQGLWVVKNVDKVLAHGNLNTYLLRGDRYLVAADNKTGNVRWVLDTGRAEFKFFLTNSKDDGIYMVKANGHTQGIREKRFAVPPGEIPAVDVAPAEE